MSKEIKHCPFCGSEAELTSSDVWGVGNIVYQMKCKNNECIAADGISRFLDTKQEAIELWNKRKD